ncbi:unnamed protein product [Brugia timori]|uniref:Uncharacterized protein n=1 Tax=Brugia timori TaxID=42155 RepID=A0A3P7X3A3_9BILA|nr:unnamed protein product [Brugia timori]
MDIILGSSDLNSIKFISVRRLTNLSFASWMLAIMLLDMGLG